MSLNVRRGPRTDVALRTRGERRAFLSLSFEISFLLASLSEGDLNDLNDLDRLIK